MWEREDWWAWNQNKTHKSANYTIYIFVFYIPTLSHLTAFEIYLIEIKKHSKDIILDKCSKEYDYITWWKHCIAVIVDNYGISNTIVSEGS